MINRAHYFGRAEYSFKDRLLQRLQYVMTDHQDLNHYVRD